MKSPYAIPAESLLKELKTRTSGLSQAEAKLRLAKHGLNVLGDDLQINKLKLFLKQFRNAMVYVLLVAAVISGIYNHFIDVAVILGVVTLNAVIGFIQEYRAEKAVSALKSLVVQKARVYRDGQIQEILAKELVVGDILYLEEGDHIPADARILDCRSFQTQESTLTGESLPIDKENSQLAEGTALADQKNMVFSGTLVARGRATAVVVATGTHTAIGAIAKGLRGVIEPPTHFEKQQTRLTKLMATVAVITAVATFATGFFIQKTELENILPFTLAAFVSAIPESLPLVFMIVLTISARRMAKRNAVVRHLSAAEALGIVNVIITDKTGTLTQNKMSVEKVFTSSSEKMRVIAALCNNIHLQADGSLLGDPTEQAMFSFARKNPSNSYKNWLKHDDLPFNQSIKARASLVENTKTKEREIFAVGAPENLLSRCEYILDGNKKFKLRNKDQQEIEKQIEALTSASMRTIGVGYKQTEDTKDSLDNKDLKNLIWVGVVGIIDPARPEAKAAIQKANNAGVRVIMATGDHPKTALAIAAEVGLPTSSVYTAQDLENLSDKQLADVVRETSLFARMTPESKLRLAKVLQDSGATIAMTGDGVNDAPALKGADVGVAMGRIGTDVARQASDIVLADDNFATIVAAIEEGRTQFRNLRRTSFFLITTNVAESVSLLAFLLLGLPIPLLPKQILWLNLIGGGVTDLALAAEPIHEDVLKDPPIAKNERILNKRVLPLLVILTLVMTVVALGVYHLFAPQGETKTRTAIFVVISLMQLINLLNVRSLKKSIFALGAFTNKQVNLALMASFILLLAVVYLPPLAKLFEFSPLTFLEFIILFALSLTILIIGEGMKLINRNKRG